MIGDQKSPTSDLNTHAHIQLPLIKKPHEPCVFWFLTGTCNKTTKWDKIWGEKSFISGYLKSLASANTSNGCYNVYCHACNKWVESLF